MSADQEKSFPPDVVEAIARHMNVDHPADSLVIVRALGGQPEATAATVTAVDREAIQFEVRVGDETLPVRLPWSTRLTERVHVRQEVVRMYDDAAAILGLPPRDHETAARPPHAGA